MRSQKRPHGSVDEVSVVKDSTVGYDFSCMTATRLILAALLSLAVASPAQAQTTPGSNQHEGGSGGSGGSNVTTGSGSVPTPAPTSRPRPAATARPRPAPTAAPTPARARPQVVVRTTPAAPVVSRPAAQKPRPAAHRKKARKHVTAAPAKPPKKVTKKPKTKTKRAIESADPAGSLLPAGRVTGPGALDWLLFVGLPLCIVALILGRWLLVQRRRHQHLASERSRVTAP